MYESEGSASALGVVAGIGRDYIGSEMNKQNQLELMAKQQEYNLDNMDKAFEMNQTAERRAGINRKFAMMSAGISPALMASGNFSVPAMQPPQAGLGHADTVANTNVGALGVMASQEASNNANARLADAQAQKVEAETENMKGEQAQWKEQLKGWLGDVQNDKKYSSSVRSMAANLSKTSDKLNTGTGKALDEFVTLLKNDRSSLTDKYIQAYQQALYKQMITDSVFKDEAERIGLTNEKIVQDIARAQADTFYLISNTELNDTQKEALDSQITKNLAEASKIHHTDIVGMMQDGTLSELAETGLVKVMELAFNYLILKGALSKGKPLIESAKGLLKGEKAAETFAKGEKAAETVAKGEKAAETVAKGEKAAETVAKGKFPTFDRSLKMPSQSPFETLRQQYGDKKAREIWTEYYDEWIYEIRHGSNEPFQKWLWRVKGLKTGNHQLRRGNH